jgi:hypothetical protein
MLQSSNFQTGISKKFKLIFNNLILRLGQPVGKELAEVSFVDLFNKGNGAILAKFEKSFGEYKMPMGVECMAVSFSKMII